MAGKLLVIEGIDACGKNTQIALLAKWLRKRKIKFHLTEEPSQIGLKKLIKNVISKKTKIDYPILDALLFSADRAIHLKKEILPALRKNKIVICDRYYHSTFAYQSTQGLDLKWLMQLNKFARKPDLTIIFDLPAEVAVTRLAKRKKFDKFEKLRFLRKLRKNYLALSKKLKEKIVVVNSDRSKKEVFEDLKKVIEKELKI